jgi:hypothetical protein
VPFTALEPFLELVECHVEVYGSAKWSVNMSVRAL